MSMHKGDGWATATLDDMGSGPGFRKVRHALDVTAFGVNAIVLPPGAETNNHYHERQEEVYFVHEGTVEITFGDGTTRTLGPGGMARVDAQTPRVLRNTTEQDAVYICFGGEGGYVGRDGKLA